MFKRRKSDDAQAPAPQGGGTLTEPTLDDPPGRVPAEEMAPSSGPRFQDSGLGVPPFRPAASPSSGPTQVSLKETPQMGRSPFSATPAPSAPNPAPVNAAPPAMRPSAAMASPAMTAAPLPAPVTPPRPVRDPAERRTLVVGRGISVQGTVQDAERLVVEGTVEASMIHATELSVSPGGVFKGEVEVDDAEVAGTIDGTLTAKNSLVVRATGRLLGSARCRRLQVEDGGQITGRIEMISEGIKAAADAAA